MNEILKNAAKNYLKRQLKYLPESNQHLFKRMYAGGNFDLDIDAVIDNMDVDKLDWAMEQVRATLDKRDKSNGNHT